MHRACHTRRIHRPSIRSRSRSCARVRSRERITSGLNRWAGLNGNRTQPGQQHRPCQVGDRATSCAPNRLVECSWFALGWPRLRRARSSCILPSYRATSGHLGPPIPSGWAAPVPLSLAMHLLCQWRRSHWHTLCMKRAAKGLTRRYGDYGCNSLRSLDLRVYDGCPTKRHSFDGPKSCQHAHFGDSAVRIVTLLSQLGPERCPLCTSYANQESYSRKHKSCQDNFVAQPFQKPVYGSPKTNVLNPYAYLRAAARILKDSVWHPLCFLKARRMAARIAALTFDNRKQRHSR